MEELMEGGVAFAIPDLWQKSSLDPFEAQQSPFEIDGLPPISK